MTLKNDGLAYASVQFMIAPIMTFYSLNEIKKWEPEQIRKQFDATDVLQARHPQGMDTNSIRKILASHLVKCGVRTVEHPTAP